jgi:hypothetical protein
VPPLTHVRDLDEALPLISELALVDDEARVVLAALDRGDDLVKRDHSVLRLDAVAELVIEPEVELQERAGQDTRNRDLCRLELFERNVALGDDHRAVLFAKAAAVPQERVLVGDVGERVDADCAGFELPFAGPLVKGLDVAQDVLELVLAAHLAAG